MSNFENNTFDTELTYRGVTFQIWNDDYGQQKFVRFVNDPLFGTQDIGLGSFNSNYEDDAHYIIDKKLDTVKRYPYPDFRFGSTIEYFDNDGFRDIRVTYRKRIIKVFLLPQRELTTEELDSVILQSEQALYKLLEGKHNERD